MKQKTDIYHVKADIDHERNGKISSKLKKIGGKVAGTLAFAYAMMSMQAVNVLAKNSAPNASAGNASNIGDGIGALGDLATTIVVAIGVIVAVFGGLQLGLGFAQDNPDAQSRGVKFLIGGVIGASVTAIVKLVSTGSGF